MNLYVGNLSSAVTQKDLRHAFEAFGEVESVKVIHHASQGAPAEFAFVRMTRDDDARRAIAGLNGTELEKRIIKVNPARTGRDRRQAHRSR
ncbi:MAG TPA: RNA-binding protein, partial [Sumerlaeia bacterium]|nr:RNA-binding protein [Sumerlaeia bacterium]